MRVIRLLAVSLVIAVHPASATDADPVLARNATEAVRLSEFILELERVPPDSRDDFLASRPRITELLAQMLVRKTLASQAKAAKLDEDPANIARLGAENLRALAQFRMASVDKRAAEEFDEKLVQHQSRARELYLVDREKLRAPEEISASHILFNVKQRSSEEALELAQRARTRLAEGADFAAVAREVSEDPSAASNGGALGWFRRERMDPKFSSAAFGLKDIGEISQPVLSQFGWHVIRLEGRRGGAIPPFESVRDQIVADLRGRYIAQRREEVLGPIRSDPQNSLNEPVLEQLVAKSRAAARSPREQR